MGFAGVSSELVSRAAFAKAAKEASRRIRYGEWTAAMTRILHAMAVLGFLGPSGLSVASGYLALMAGLAAERGPDFAIQYDRDLRKHIASVSIAVAEVAAMLRSLDVHRADRIQRKLDFDAKARKEAEQAKKKPTQPLQGKGGSNAPKQQSSGSQHRGQGGGSQRGRGDRGRRDGGDQPKRKAEGQGDRPQKGNRPR